jgi:hypothetical protein
MTVLEKDYDDVAKEVDLLVSLRSQYVVSFKDALRFDDQFWVGPMLQKSDMRA